MLTFADTSGPRISVVTSSPLMVTRSSTTISARSADAVAPSASCTSTAAAGPRT
ncbi:MAG: hypothetical protein V9G12_21135 [Microthrixaceae bacterium]